MAKGQERKGPTFYYEWQDQIEQLPLDYQLTVIKGIWHYDRYEEKLDTDDPILKVLMEKYYYEIDKQRENWENKSGRPARYDLEQFAPYFDAGCKDSEIAKAIGCSAKTAARKRKEWIAASNLPTSEPTGQNAEDFCPVNWTKDKEEEEDLSFVLSKTMSSRILSTCPDNVQSNFVHFCPNADDDNLERQDNDGTAAENGFEMQAKLLGF